MDEQVGKVVCQLCLGCEDAGTVTRTRVHWAQCVKCKAMFHNNCVGIKKKLDNWICAMCVAGEKSVQGASGGTSSKGAPTGAAPKPNLVDPVKTNSQPIPGDQQETQDDPRSQMESASLELEFEITKKLLEKRRAQEQERLKREQLMAQLREMERELHELAVREAEANKREAEAQAESQRRVAEIEAIRSAASVQVEANRSAATAQAGTIVGEPEIPIGAQPINTVPNQTEFATHRTPDQQVDMNLSQHMSSFVEQQAYLINRQFLSELPEFSGTSEDWPVWFAQFKSSTLEGGFSSAQNMTRLRKCLKGKALDAVRGALSLPDNVNSVIAILTARFGNMDVIVHSKMQKLETIQPPCDTKPETVVAFFEFLLNMRATLSNANARAYLRAPQTLDTIVRKLPPGAQTAWMIHKAARPDHNLDNFLDWYEPTYRSAAFRLEAVQTAKNQRVNYHEVTKDKRSEVTKNCLFCRKDNHLITDCRRFNSKNLKTRWEFVKKERLCFKCLLGRHMIKNCELKSSCGIGDCKKEHHKLLHKMESANNEETVARQMPDKVETVGHQSGPEKTYFRVVPVRLSNDGDSVVETWAFLDQGSGPTLMADDLAQKLKLNGSHAHLCLKWTNGTTTTLNSEVVNVNIAGIDEKKKFVLSNVYVVPEPNLDLPGPEFDINQLKLRYSHLKDVNIPEIPMHRVGILIGLEHAKLTIPYQIREGAWNEPIATKTRIGWSIYGKTNSGNNSVNYVCTVCECIPTQESMDDLIRSFQTTESFGVTPPVKELRSLEDERSMEIFDKTLKLTDGRYEVGLLWKCINPQLPDNRKMAMRRLVCLEQRLLKDPVAREAVVAKIRDNVEKGYLVETDEEEIANFKGPKWFLPMFGVQNPNKPGKLRLVYDAAARCDGIALNDVLMKGPDNLSSLLGVLLRFRNGKVGFCGDIAEMFHRVKLIKEDQYVQLILWRDVNPDIPPKIFKLAVMSFGATCSPSAAQHVKNINARKFKDKWPRAVEAILNHHYVDDYLDCANSVTEAIELAQQVIKIHQSGGFHIRNWISNYPEVVRGLNPMEITTQQKEIVNLDMEDAKEAEKVLGMRWNTREDCFIFQTNFSRVKPEILNQSRKPTKREVLRAVMSLFDPFGILATVVMPAKILIQDLWRCGCEWDQQIPDEINSAWKNWLQALELVKNVKVPRWLSPLLEQDEDTQLHVFSDASELAFCAVAYMRISGNGKVETPFVCSKTRVAPTKSLSIPRLELQGAVLASRLATTLKKELSFQPNKVFFWTDSQTVLGWLRSPHRKYSAFVAHRVGEILDHTSLNEWRWVPGKENVADEGTKWEGIPQVTPQWLEGPAFLAHPSEKWPVEKAPVSTTVEEEKTVQFHAPQRKIVLKYDVIRAERFSNWKRILRMTAFILRYIQKLKLRTQDKSGNKMKIVSDVKEAILNSQELNGAELDNAQNLLFKKIQSECYDKEVGDLTKKGAVDKKSPIYNLTPTMDDCGIIRIKTRLDAAPAFVEPNMKRPILIDGKHPITSLIIQSAHRRFHHCNREAVTNELRQHLWIPKIRLYVNKVIARCTLCAYHKARPVIPQMAPLPAQRMAPYEPPFSKTGLDYAGPFEVVIGRRREKRWIALFTCLTMRAVHLEVAHTLDTSSCVMAIRNFMNRRGVPTEIFSDNGTNLKSSEKELRLLLATLDSEKIVAESQPLIPGSVNIRWHFITPSASHFGGVWERMVRLVKTSLYMVLKSRAPHDEIFRSAIIEVEATVNSRPLHYVSAEDPCEPAISPNSLLRLNPKGGPLPENHENIKSKKQWIMVQEIAQEFWRKWLHQYLPTIATRTKWFTESEPLKIGTLVLVVDENLKRGEWQRGIVQATHTSYDGKVRSATVKTAKGTYRRPVAKLAVIDPKVMGSQFVN